MKALILAGGEGTRLRPLTYTTPKSLLPICNRPFLEHQLRLMRGHGITDAMLLTGYLADAFDPFVERMAGEGITLEVVRETEPLGTAGAVRNVLDRLDGTTIVFNGDVLTDLDLTELVAEHRDRSADVTLTLKRVSDAGPYGLVPLDHDGWVEEFLEKPPPEVARRGGLINAGTYVIEPEVLADIPSGVMWSFERQLFPELIPRAGVLGFPSKAYWLDIGIPERYLQAHWDVLDGKAKTTEPVGHRVGSVLLAEGAEAPEGTELAVLGPGAVIEQGAKAERVVMLAGARIATGSSLRDSILGPGRVYADEGDGAGLVLAAEG